MATQLFAAGSPDVLYIVDLSGYVLRAYHAISELHSASGEPTHAVLGTVNMLELLVREQRPTFLAIAMDSGRSTFRKQIYDGYKATRPAAPEDLKQQMRRCKQIVEAFAVPILQQDGVEADDLIACAVLRARQHQLKVVIVAADKDLMQLAGPDVIMWDTMRNRVFGPEEIEARFGVKLTQLRDLFALMGDTSDNIPGVPSVGPKTARDLLVEFGTLERIYENLDSIKRKALKEALANHREQAFLSQRLVTLKEDCPIQFDVESLRYGGRDVESLRQIYTELGFNRQLAALDTEPVAQNTARVTASKGAPVASECTAVTSIDQLESVLEAARRAKRLALHTEVVSIDRNAALAGLSLAVQPGKAHYLPLAHRYLGVPAQLALGEAAEKLAPVLADPSIAKIAHDLKRAAVDLAHAGMSLEGFSFDAQLASYLIDPEARHGLPEIAQREFGVVLLQHEQVTQKSRGHRLSFDEVAVEDATSYCGVRADMSLQLEQRLAPRLHEEGLGRVFTEIELPLAKLLAELELRGVLVDVSRLAELGARCDKEIQRLEAEAHRIAGKPFNVNSPRQLETLLFDELGLKPTKRTKTARSTDAATLEGLAELHELPRVILGIRQYAKLKGTYIDALPSLIDSRTGRIHTRWEQAVAATGRLSSTDPNLQNIPIRTELGRDIREAFVAPPGSLIVSADYSQIELRILAHLSKDPVLVEAFRTGQDVHTRTAMEIFEVAEANVTREMRTRSKAVNFGVIYGQGDSGLAKATGISRAEAANFIAAYFRRYEGVRRFMNETLDNARAGEAVRSLLGRRRMLPDIRSANRAKRLAAERIAMNMPIQGTAADLLKLAMLALAKPVTPGTRMISTVHDELVFEVPEAEVEEAERAIRRAMENVYPLEVPLVVDVGHGKNWNQAH